MLWVLIRTGRGDVNECPCSGIYGELTKIIFQISSNMEIICSVYTQKWQFCIHLVLVCSLKDVKKEIDIIIV